MTVVDVDTGEIIEDELVAGYDDALWRACLLTTAGEGRHVYFVHAALSRSVKIGSSTNPLTRLDQLRTGSPELLHLAAVIPFAGFLGEHAIHDRLNRHRLHGEWFTLAPEVVSVIREARR